MTGADDNQDQRLGTVETQLAALGHQMQQLLAVMQLQQQQQQQHQMLVLPEPDVQLPAGGLDL